MINIILDPILGIEIIEELGSRVDRYFIVCLFLCEIQSIHIVYISMN